MVVWPLVEGVGCSLRGSGWLLLEEQEGSSSLGPTTNLTYLGSAERGWTNDLGLFGRAK